MKITLKLFATLRDFGENIKDIDIDAGSTPKDVIRVMGLPEDDVAIIMINGRRLKDDVVLNEGDVLALFPAVGGG